MGMTAEELVQAFRRYQEGMRRVFPDQPPAILQRPGQGYFKDEVGPRYHRVQRRH